MNTKETKYQKAKEKVAALKGFYVHISVYVIVNLGLFLINMIVSPDGLWFLWPLSVFGFGPGFGADWEERKIRELMEKE